MYKYLEVIEDETKEVVCRIDVTDQSDRVTDRITNGMSLNLNHNKYSIVVNESEKELPKI